MALRDPLGIIAGAGELPIALAHAVREDGRPVFVVALEGIADAPAIGEFPHAWSALGELSRTISLLKDAGCEEVTLAGHVARPDFSGLKLDRLGGRYIGRVLAAALKGDDALLRAIISIFESQGLRVIGSSDVTRALLAESGPVGRLAPHDDDRADIGHGIRVVQALGALDIGQAAVVCRGLVLAVEAAEGTDAMLQRVAQLPPQLRGKQPDRRGVLVKAVKPGQDRRVDLPVVGARTVELAAAAGLAGIAIQAGTVLVLNRARVAEIADREHLFVFGIDAADG
jgi:hypothetical protein